MPCNYNEYHPKWPLIIRMVKRRDGNRCKWCGIPNKVIVVRLPDGTTRNVLSREWQEYNQYRRGGYSKSQALKILGFTKVVLTVAHIDHDKDNNRFDNLAALCQRCHLQHDSKQHVANRKYGRNHNNKHQIKIEL